MKNVASRSLLTELSWRKRVTQVQLILLSREPVPLERPESISEGLFRF